MPRRLDLLNTLPVLVHKLDDHVTAALDDAAAAASLSPRAVTVLSEVATEEPRSQRELSRRTRIDQTTIVAAVDELERHQLVQRVTDPLDRRHRRIVVTGSGVAVLERTAAKLREIEDQMFVGLTARERDQLGSLLRKAIAAQPTA